MLPSRAATTTLTMSRAYYDEDGDIIYISLRLRPASSSAYPTYSVMAATRLSR